MKITFSTILKTFFFYIGFCLLFPWTYFLHPIGTLVQKTLTSPTHTYSFNEEILLSAYFTLIIAWGYFSLKCGIQAARCLDVLFWIRKTSGKDMPEKFSVFSKQQMIKAISILGFSAFFICIAQKEIWPNLESGQKTTTLIVFVLFYVLLPLTAIHTAIELADNAKPLGKGCD